jgi:hypothetical protein
LKKETKKRIAAKAANSNNTNTGRKCALCVGEKKKKKNEVAAKELPLLLWVLQLSWKERGG